MTYSLCSVVSLLPFVKVAENFASASLLDPNVVFVKGFFNNTMPPLSKQVGKLAIMRLDGDMYQSTVDVLYHLYDKLSLNGYVIIDDWVTTTVPAHDYPAKTACDDFRRVHKITAKIIPIDDTAVYWQKTEEVDVQKWRYAQYKFTD